MVAGDLDGNKLDDLVMDFGPLHGLWAWMNHESWVALHPSSPNHMITGNLDFAYDHQDELVADFPGFGLWIWKYSSGWELLHSLSASHLAVGNMDDAGGMDLIVDFPGTGLWVYGTEPLWRVLHPFDVTAMVTAYLWSERGNWRDKLVANFPGLGVWVYWNDVNATWTLLGVAANHLAAGDLDGNSTRRDDLVIDFGAGQGVWVYWSDGTRTPLHTFPTEGLATGNIDGNERDDVAIDFGSAGLWVFKNGSTWQQVHWLNAVTTTMGRLH
jgi:hypothetical protein